MLALMSDAAEAVTHIAVAFDNPIRSFRNDLFAGYKSDEGVPPELRAQFDSVEEGVRAIGITVWSMQEYEADDAIATGAKRFRDEVEQVRIMSPDKDFGQCLLGERVVQIDRRQQKLINESALRKLRGIAPESLPDFSALTGDTADGIPGLPGFGEKSAGDLLAVYPHLELIPEHAHQWTAKVRGANNLASTLVARRKDALFYRKLATLVDNVPLPYDLAQLEWRGVPRARFERWCDEVGVTTLRSVPKRWTD